MKPAYRSLKQRECWTSTRGRSSPTLVSLVLHAMSARLAARSISAKMSRKYG